MVAATEKLAQRLRDGPAPKVKVYDKAAPSQRWRFQCPTYSARGNAPRRYSDVRVAR